MRPLSAERASACEAARHPRCRCRCGGLLHGRAHPEGFERFDDGIIVQADVFENIDADWQVRAPDGTWNAIEL